MKFDDLIYCAVEALPSLVALVLFLGMIAVWSALACGA